MRLDPKKLEEIRARLATVELNGRGETVAARGRFAALLEQAPEDLALLVEEVERLQEILGDISTTCEDKELRSRRSGPEAVAKRDAIIDYVHRVARRALGKEG